MNSEQMIRASNDMQRAADTMQSAANQMHDVAHVLGQRLDTFIADLHSVLDRLEKIGAEKDNAE
jgi:hypothetical protein